MLCVKFLFNKNKINVKKVHFPIIALTSGDNQPGAIEGIPNDLFSHLMKEIRLKS